MSAVRVSQAELEPRGSAVTHYDRENKARRKERLAEAVNQSDRGGQRRDLRDGAFRHWMARQALSDAQAQSGRMACHPRQQAGADPTRRHSPCKRESELRARASPTPAWPVSDHLGALSQHKGAEGCEADGMLRHTSAAKLGASTGKSAQQPERADR